MQLLMGTGLPLLVVLAMTIAGMELTLADLSRVIHYPLQVLAAASAQLLVLPLVAAGLIALLDPPPAIAGGLLLAAAAPQATVSNFFCLIARADIALCVTLTAISSVIALISTPIVAGIGFRLLLGDGAGFVLPAGKAMQQVALGLLLPVAAGMMLRHTVPQWVARHRKRFRTLSLIALAALLAAVMVDQAAIIVAHLGGIVVLATLFTVAAAALGYALARALSWPYVDRVTLIAAFPARSLSLATLIAVNVLGRLEFLSFAVVFFLVQAALLTPLMVGLRRGRTDAVPD